MATNGRQLRYLSTSNEESAKLFMVIDLLLQESVVVIIDFVDILRSNISTERMVHGYGQQLDDRGGNVWFVVDTASYGRLYRYNRIYIHSIPVFHTLQPCGQADGYWIKLSTVVPGSRLKVKKKRETKSVRQSLYALHIHIHLTFCVFLIPTSTTNMPRQRELTKHQYSAGLTYVAQKPSFLQNFGKPQVPPPSSSASSRGGREPLPERPNEGQWATGSGDEAGEREDDDEDDEWGDVFGGGGEEGPQVVVLKEGRHLTAEEIKRERRKGVF